MNALQYLQERYMMEFDEIIAQYQVAYEIGDLARAQALLERALKIEPDDAQLWGDLGSLLIDAGQFAAALEALDHAAHLLADGEKTAHYYDLRGICLYQLDRLPEAETCFWLALRIENRAFLWNRLGHTLYRADREIEAMDCYRRALEIDPSHEESLLLLAEALDVRCENPVEIETLLRRAIAANANCAGAWSRLGQLLNDKHRATRDSETLKKARRTLSHALYLNPDDIWARIHFANLLWMNKELEAAEKHYRRVYKISCDDETLRHIIGALLAAFLSAEHIDAELAEQLLRVAIAHEADNVNHNAIFGTHLYRYERDDEARPFLQFAAARGHKRAAKLLRELNAPE